MNYIIELLTSQLPFCCLQARNKADKSASNSLNPSIFEGLVTLCAPDAVCFSRHVPHASGRILAERFYVIGTLRSNFLLHKKTCTPFTAYMSFDKCISLIFKCEPQYPISFRMLSIILAFASENSLVTAGVSSPATQRPSCSTSRR